MSGKSRLRSADSIIGALAARQHGSVGRWQLLARGLSRDQIDWRIRSGRLIPVHRGIYLVGHTATAPLAYEAAAILAFRGQATISHRSAAKLHGLLPWPPKAACWVTTPRGDSDRPGLIVRKATLDPSDITSIERIKTTTAARAILDCAAILPPDEDYRLETMCAEGHSKLHLVRRDRAADLGDWRDSAGASASKHIAKRPPLPGRASRLSRVSDQRALRVRRPGSGRRWGSSPTRRRVSRATSATSRTDRPVALLKVLLCIDGSLPFVKTSTYGLMSKPRIAALYRRSGLVCGSATAKLSS